MSPSLTPPQATGIGYARATSHSLAWRRIRTTVQSELQCREAAPTRKASGAHRDGTHGIGEAGSALRLHESRDAIHAALTDAAPSDGRLVRARDLSLTHEAADTHYEFQCQEAALTRKAQGALCDGTHELGTPHRRPSSAVYRAAGTTEWRSTAFAMLQSHH
ncbi:hypothetical protein GY45DRAFT_1376549 [Cubamyces sp. BRFM 1775]|nr:hypothetical protein GY45DRAFT_1376549 [Cubamyces sp. BRFM 1775]